MGKFNIKTKAAADTATVELLDAHGEPMMTDDEPPQPVTATIYGPGSKQQADAIARHRARQLRAQKDRKGRELTADERRAAEAELLADVTVSLNNLTYVDDAGNEPAGRELLVAVYGDSQLGYIADQINRKSNDWSVFTKASPKS